MNVLLVTPAEPGKSPFSTKEKRMPLGIGSLASVIRQAGHEVQFIDNYLQPTGFPDDGYLEKHHVDAVGIYVNTVCLRDAIRMMCRLESLRRQGKWQGKILCGGPHVSVAPETLPDFVDHLVQGEGEGVILDVLEGKAPRIVKATRVPDLDTLPTPAWDLFENLPYDRSTPWFPDQPVFTMNTSRGCPFKCAFCSVGSIWGRSYRAQSPERVIAEIDHLVERYHAKGIYFREDNFTLNWKRVERFCELLNARPYKIKWMCESRVDGLTIERLTMMKQAGLGALYIGFESGSQRMLDFLTKGIKLERSREAARNCRAAGVAVAGSFVVGLPTETQEEMQQTVNFAEELQLSTCWMNVFVGLPKSRMWTYAQENDLVEYKDDRGLLFLKGHDQRVDCFYGGLASTKIPRGPGEDGFIPRHLQELEEVKPQPVSVQEETIPRVSIIMPTYQRPKLIREALSSLQSQTFTDFEVVVVDDGGCDETRLAVADFKDARFRYNRVPHGGLSRALNAGLQRARGHYVGYLDDDDIYYPNHLETLVSALDQGPEPVAYTDAIRAVQRPVRPGSTDYEVVSRTPSWEVNFSRELYLVTNYTPILTVMHRRDLLEQTGGFDADLPVLMDWEFWIRMSQQARFRRLPVKTCEFRVREDGSNMTAEKVQDFAACRQTIQARYEHLLMPVLTGVQPVREARAPEISVVMSVYNGARYLEEAVHSILSQTLADFEFLIIDDGSSDGTAEILGNCRDPRIKVITHPRNIGLTPSLNEGIRQARGAFIARQDADDLSHPERLARQLRHLKDHPDCAAVGAFTHVIDPSSKVVGVVNKPITDIQIRECLRYDNCIAHGSVLMRKDALIKVGLYDESVRVAQDYDLFVRLSESYTMANLNDYLYSWRLHEESISSQRAEEQKRSVLLTREKARQRYEKRLQEQPTEPAFSVLMANYNNGRYIAEAIQSVLAQTMDQWELLILDDASTDDSLERIQPFLNNPRIRLIRNERNRGYVPCLKRLIDESRADWLGIFDSDDVLMPDALEMVCKAFAEDLARGFVYSQYIECDENLRPTGEGHSAMIPPGKTNLQSDCVSAFRTFRKEDYFKTAGLDEAILYAEDKDLIYKMEEVTQLYFVDQVLYYYRVLDKSQSHDPNKKNQGICSWLEAKYNAFKRRLNTGIPNIPAEKLAADLYKAVVLWTHQKELEKASHFLALFKEVNRIQTAAREQESMAGA